MIVHPFQTDKLYRRTVFYQITNYRLTNFVGDNLLASRTTPRFHLNGINNLKPCRIWRMIFQHFGTHYLNNATYRSKYLQCPCSQSCDIHNFNVLKFVLKSCFGHSPWCFRRVYGMQFQHVLTHLKHVAHPKQFQWLLCPQACSINNFHVLKHVRKR